jgi:hypothetical protein
MAGGMAMVMELAPDGSLVVGGWPWADPAAMMAFNNDRDFD